MDETRESPTDGRAREHLVERLDKMIESARVTEQEAKRLRGAGGPSEFDDAVLDIRVRHAGTILDAAVDDGSLTVEEADGFLERLRTGEHPRALRAQLRRLRQRPRSGADVSGLHRLADGPQPDAPA
jgi:hypothetical protein